MENGSYKSSQWNVWLYFTTTGHNVQTVSADGGSAAVLQFKQTAAVSSPR